MNPLGVAILGCGGIGRWHARQVQGLPGMELVAMVDPDAAARAKAGREFKTAVAADATDVLASGRVTLVSICTPPSSHAELAVAASAAGKHVLVEKPMALDLASADRMLAAAQAAGTLLGVVHQQRSHPACRALHRLIRDGMLGQPRLITACQAWHRPADAAIPAWRSGGPGGALLLDQAIHVADLLLWLFGPVRWVQGTTAVCARGAAHEDTALGQFQFASGALGTLAASSVVNATRDDISIEVWGTEGSARLEIRDYDNAELTRLDLASAPGRRASTMPADRREALVIAEGGSWRNGPANLPWRILAKLAGRERGAHPFRSPRAWLRRQADRVAQRETQLPQGHAALLAQMAHAVRTGGVPSVPGDEGRAALAFVLAISESAGRQGCQIDLSTGRSS